MPRGIHAAADATEGEIKEDRDGETPREGYRGSEEKLYQRGYNSETAEFEIERLAIMCRVRDIACIA